MRLADCKLQASSFWKRSRDSRSQIGSRSTKTKLRFVDKRSSWAASQHKGVARIYQTRVVGLGMALWGEGGWNKITEPNYRANQVVVWKDILWFARNKRKTGVFRKISSKFERADESQWGSRKRQSGKDNKNRERQNEDRAGVKDSSCWAQGTGIEINNRQRAATTA